MGTDRAPEDHSPQGVDWQIGFRFPKKGPPPDSSDPGRHGNDGTRGTAEGAETGPDTGCQGRTRREIDPDADLRLVARKRPHRSQSSPNKYNRMGAGSLAARIQYLANGRRLVPDQAVEVREIDRRETGGRFSQTLITYGVFTAAQDWVVRWAEGLDPHADGRPPRETALIWGLSEWHIGNWVRARRLFAAAREPKWSQHALSKWEARTLRAFPREIRFPSHSYETFAEYGETYGAFYFGSNWEGAQPRRSRTPLWPSPKARREPRRW